MEPYVTKQFFPEKTYSVSVPASKSALSRALLLSAVSPAPVRLFAGALCEDTRTLVSCLKALGVTVKEEEDGLTVMGTGQFPNRRCTLDVGSAGTAARFLPAVLAFRGGDYTFVCSPQMNRRPMEILPLLQEAGADVEYLGEEGKFPFRLRSDGIGREELSVNTDKSTQFASAILLAGRPPLKVTLTGSRRNGSYIRLTLGMMEEFGLPAVREGDAVTLLPRKAPPEVYAVEPDLSGACYFFALALLCRARILVRGVRRKTSQGDAAFLDLLEARGLTLTETEEGLLADGSRIAAFDGFDADFQNFSDQALTAAALAPFAATPTHLRGLAHTRLQECDRMQAIVTNLRALGVPCRMGEGDIFIEPAPVRPAVIETFGDHRVAMAFALTGLKAGGVTIDRPGCCRKTFENYFDLLTALTR